MSAESQPPVSVVRAVNATDDLFEFGDDTAHHAAFAAANQVRMDAASNWMSTRFPGLDMAAPVTHADTSQFEAVPCLIPADELHVAWSNLCRVASGTPVTAGALQFAMQGIVNPPAGAVKGPGWEVWAAGPLAAALGGGQSLIVKGISRSVRLAGELAAAIETLSGTAVEVNAYVSQRAQPGFEPHWDGHDTLIVPILGEKHWKVFEPTRAAAPAAEHGAHVIGPVAFDGVLAPGTALSIPRGWAHEPVAHAGLCAHLTVAIDRPRLDTALQMWASQVRGSVAAVDLPTTIDAAFATTDLGADALAGVRRFQQWRRATVPSRSVGGLEGLLALTNATAPLGPVSAQTVAAGGVVGVRNPAGDSDALLIAGGGFVLQVRADAVEPVSALWNGTRVVPDELSTETVNMMDVAGLLSGIGLVELGLA